MKRFQPAAWFLPQPVTILGTYNEDGSPNAMNAAWAGRKLGPTVGKAFVDGKQIG